MNKSTTSWPLRSTMPARSARPNPAGPRTLILNQGTSGDSTAALHIGCRVRILSGEFAGFYGRIIKPAGEFPRANLVYVDLDGPICGGIWSPEALEAVP